MSFLAPLAPLAMRVGGSLATSALGNLFTPGANRQQSQAMNLLQQAQQSGMATGQNLLGQGQSAIQQPINYWSSLLSGNRGAMTSALAPEISRIGQGYQQAARTSAALNPRGGPSVEFNAELPFQQQRDVSTLFQQVRPMAAQQLGGLGNNLLSSGANLLMGSTSAGRDLLSSQQALRDLQARQGSDIGKGLFGLFQQYGMPALETILGKIGGQQRQTRTMDPSIPGGVLR